MKKIIASGQYWVCENLDLLAPIIEQGIECLMNDGTREHFPSEDVIDYEYASEEEKHEFYNNMGLVFIGDKVDIVKGKLKGNTKEIKGFFRYIVPNTYGKAYTDYISFTDGTKTAITNCEINGKRAFEFKGINVGGRI